MITPAIREILMADAEIIAQVATYNGAPAVFTVDPAPADCGQPVIVINEVGGFVGLETRCRRGYTASADVRIYDDKGLSKARIRTIAQRVWELLHRAELELDGYEAVVTLCQPPVDAPDPDGYPGLSLSTSVTILEVEDDV